MAQNCSGNSYGSGRIIKKENKMKRRKMSKGHSKRVFKKNLGVQAMNDLNPRRMRGGIRL